jgi:hypothetical protein
LPLRPAHCPHRRAVTRHSGGGRVDRSGLDVQNRSLAVENFHRWSIRITVAEPACAGFIRLRSRPRPPRGCRAQLNTMTPALAAARAGVVSLVRTKKNSCTERTRVDENEHDSFANASPSHCGTENDSAGSVGRRRPACSVHWRAPGSTRTAILPWRYDAPAVLSDCPVRGQLFALRPVGVSRAAPPPRVPERRDRPQRYIAH